MDKDKLKYYERYYFANAEPVPFTVKDNNYIIHIKPVTVKMYPFYQDNINILLIDKNRIGNVEIIQMSYLQYLIDVVFQEKDYQKALVTILDLSLGEEYTYTVGHLDNGKPYLGLVKDDELLCKITPKEFDKISEIILYYNDRHFDSNYMSEDVRKAMEDYYKLKFKDTYMPTLEERKAFVSFKSGLTLNEINDLTYRYFDLIYNTCIDNDMFFSQKIIQASEKYKVNDNEIVYPLFKKKNDKLDFFQDAEQWTKKVSAAAKGFQ